MDIKIHKHHPYGVVPQTEITIFYSACVRLLHRKQHTILVKYMGSILVIKQQISTNHYQCMYTV